MPDDADRSALLLAIDADLAAVEQALARLDEGSYDRCEVCSGPLGEALLAAEPLRRRCSLHAGA